MPDAIARMKAAADLLRIQRRLTSAPQAPALDRLHLAARANQLRQMVASPDFNPALMGNSRRK